MMIPAFSRFCLAAAIGALLSSCQKDEGPTLVDGQVIEMRTERPVPYAWVEVYAQSGSGLHSGYSASTAPRQADATGRFHFQFEAEAGTSYVLKAYSDAGHGSHWGEEPYLKKGRKNQNLRLGVAAPAWLKIRVEQKAGRVPDAIYAWGPWRDQGYISSLDLRPKDYGAVTYHVMDSTIPESGLVVHWDANFGGKVVRHEKAFSVQPLDTTEVVLTY
ncbi:hypothetical protein K3G63_11960 [Hymenobacter sp. HSC-4F20]|uniref:hypothetical protein n=1 Tax=Hymenobacter sp. HSC-4F20 TaxID=2864135 RepID=UPI001C730584|nr:hypothetical protein [Hymenobacter sp. HSC-4F20]MBX0291162.1 hypothetical protein [Hymenobacter sp. HSC-4F20]